MNYEQMFEDSYARVIGKGIGLGEKGRLFFSRFYEKFLLESPVARSKFDGVDMAAQIRVLEKSMFHMIGFYVAKTDTRYLRSIAHRHSQRQLDIKPEYYDVWLDALIDTVKELDADFHDELELAWRLAMTPGIQFMKFHYPGTDIK